jgi:hypothetical protein
MTIWHWLVVLLVFAVPLWILWAVIRSAVRSGVRDANKKPPR